MCLLSITQNFCPSVIISDIIKFFQHLTETHLWTNQSLITLFYCVVKNLTSIFSYCIGPKCVSSNNESKALSVCDNHFSLNFITRPSNDLLKNKQLIVLLYNEMKSLSSILSCCIGLKCVFLTMVLNLYPKFNLFDLQIICSQANNLSIFFRTR